MARGCARIDSRLDTVKISLAGRVEVHHARFLAVIGVRKTFPHGLGTKRTCRSILAMSVVDAVDGSSTGTGVPRMGFLLRPPLYGGANHASNYDNRSGYSQVSLPGARS